ncbi:hypothetical protein AVEN_74253-1 [Araneus ventricosus]|uniref:Uncharacterized protein n=1 Tax=Araneus ventricosus TaxID=182803 RepID=A0A4Y2EVB8_ARAVE|nr:hypothetical protein AVEN_74253-1 [Araneus ventricosus]
MRSQTPMIESGMCMHFLGDLFLGRGLPEFILDAAAAAAEGRSYRLHPEHLAAMATGLSPLLFRVGMETEGNFPHPRLSSGT